MDKKYLENNRMFSKEKINDFTTIYWYKEPNNQFRVKVMLYNREIYNKVLDSKHYKIYHNYIEERIKYLLKERILNKDYSMILLDNTMYRVLDRDEHFKSLLRILVPVNDFNQHNVEDKLFDLVLDSTLRTGETFDEYDLVYHNCNFFLNGKRIGSISDFDDNNIPYDLNELLFNITYEQLIFLKPQYSRIIRYITEKVDLYVEDIIRYGR